MSTLVKYKIIGISVSLLLSSFLIIYYFTNYDVSDNDRRKYWTPDSTLYQSDFMRMPRLIHKMDASIFTGIYWERMENGKYQTKAVIDRYKSYMVEKQFSEYLLNHEKYHANITALITKEINDSIINRSFSSSKEFISYLDIFENKKKILQEDYDRYTKHGVNKPYQYYWEYKIDSAYYYNEDIDMSDIYSGISCYFPSKPEVTIYVDTFLMRKMYVLDKYNMRFRYYTDFDIKIDTISFLNSFIHHIKNENFINLNISDTLLQGLYIINSECDDTATDRKFIDKIVYSNPYLYHLTVNYPLTTENDSLFKFMSNQFQNSLKISRNDKYWISVFENQKRKISKRTDFLNISKAKDNFITISYNENITSSVVYHRPINYNDYLLIPFKSVIHKTKEIEELIAIVNDDYIFSQPPDSIDQIFCLDMKENNIRKVNNLLFGYTLKSDSIKNNYKIYGTEIQ